ncbi:MAG TPA: homoserine dehydrogenase [Thermoanaerobaculia bacterium]|nr:homoserine dehydrogenase [Thermoanaerobaculia bacterium]HXK69122.1 homoserine dehydrogenase [Thermoanaerobaculia bacterium]
MKALFIGFGTVGQGLAELLVEKEQTLRECHGLEVKVVGIADMQKGTIYDPGGIDLTKALDAVKAGTNLEGAAGPKFEGDVLTLIRQADADVMLEATYTDIKTGEPATGHVRAALERGMHVVTSNKGPLALHYRELAELARNHGVKFLFEGTVMSGTPLLNLIRETLAGTKITEIKGILNGTTNYILTRMEEGLSYEDALKKAQELGYAEAVPDADVLGWDALAKVTILANVVFGAKLKPFDNPCEGITGITADMIRDAKGKGKRYKLIGRIWRDGDHVKASVAPMQMDLAHPLAGVMGATNAATITTDSLSDVTVVGPGAGRKETGYSMLIDLIHAGGCR